MSESGPDSGASGTDRRSDRQSGVPVPGHQPPPVGRRPPYDGDAARYDEYGEPEEQTTTAIPRPPDRAGPPDRSGPSADSAWQPTTALPRPPVPPRPQYGPPRNPAPPNGSRFGQPTGTPPPVGPSWAAQEPYQHGEPDRREASQPGAHQSDARQRDHREERPDQARRTPPRRPDERESDRRGVDRDSGGSRRPEFGIDRRPSAYGPPSARPYPAEPYPADSHRAEPDRDDRSRPDRYRQDGYRQGDYRQDEYSQDEYRQGGYRQDPRRPDPRRSDSYPSDQYASDGYTPDQYAPGQFAPDQYASDPYAPDRYAADQYAADPYPGDAAGEPYQRDEYDHPRPAEARRQPPPRGSHLPPYQEPLTDAETPNPSATKPGMRSPRKLTVTRVAALRSRELTHRGVQMFHRATTADGADKSGLTALTYAVMANYAVDAVLAVSLAGTLFFAAATAESTGRVLLYLVITVAPFAFIAPFIGPMLDRLQHGRRLALAMSSFGRALLAILMAFNFSNFNPWVIYPCALGNLVLSKAFGVLKAALTPRVLPEQITLVKTNSRLTTFGMIAGGVAGAIAAGLSKIAGSPGALFFMAACAVAGGVLCLRIPAWVESTEGEVPVKRANTGAKKGFPQIVVATLWANSMIRVETGFLALFIAFVVKSQYPQPAHSAFTQLLLLGVIGAAAGVGGFIGNTMGARLTLSSPETMSLIALVSVLVSTIIAILIPGLATAAIVGFVGSTASSLAKVSLDSVIQGHLPEESRASGFGVSESVLQLGWVFGGVVGLLLGGVWTFGHANVYAIGFGTITVLLLVGLVQSWLVRSGRTMLPKLPARGSGKKANGHQTDRLARPGSPTTAVLPEVGGFSGQTHPAAYGSGPSNEGGTTASGAKPGRRIRKAGKD